MSGFLQVLKMFSKYILVGVSNTLVTAIVIFLLMKLGFGIYTSNAIGYSIGIILSFTLNTLFTFSQKITIIRFLKFMLNCGICYLINLIAITLILYINEEWIYFSQLAGMGTYTITGFLLNKLWVMK